VHLAVALDGAGHHPAAWRDPAGPAARPVDPFDPRHWVEAVQRVDRGGVDLVTFEDTFGPPPVPRGRTDRVRARPDAALVAAMVAPLTQRVGLVPVVTVTHTEPFHVASATSTLDHISRGRAGWQVRVSPRPADAELVGVLTAPPVDELFAEAVDAVDAVRHLWDSWEDDAVVKDVATGRYIDRDKLHHVDFAGSTFSVRGPSIVPRPPQGQPVVAALSHVPIADDLAARSADLVFVTPHGPGDVARRLRELRATEAAVHRPGEPLKVFADLVVFLAATRAEAVARKDRLDELDGAEWRPDAAVFAGTADELADIVVAGGDAGLDGHRLRPGVLGPDLAAIVDGLIPALRRRGAHPPAGGPETSNTPNAQDGPDTLRARLGLSRPASRYAGSAR
jgi:alkanesulfonate monooxygenase SsuD/methylene tetrahydromethanopterin reductase-like flavin-dependent oxidoreductase (luciferase family)